MKQKESKKRKIVFGEIEKGIPLTPKAVNRSQYRWQDMEVGDSVRFEDPGWRPKLSPLAYQAAYEHGVRHGKKFVGRTQEDGSYRIWRIA